MIKRFYIASILGAIILSMCGCAQGADVINNISDMESSETESISDAYQTDVETQENGIVLPDIDIEDGITDMESNNVQSELGYNEGAVSTEEKCDSENDSQWKSDTLCESSLSQEGSSSQEENNSSELQDGENSESKLELPMDVW